MLFFMTLGFYSWLKCSLQRFFCHFVGLLFTWWYFLCSMKVFKFYLIPFVNVWIHFLWQWNFYIQKVHTYTCILMLAHVLLKEIRVSGFMFTSLIPLDSGLQRHLSMSIYFHFLVDDYRVFASMLWLYWV